ncbi:MAG: hypothetical protein ACPG7F_02175 [Aggregatilineales bacterium]
MSARWEYRLVSVLKSYGMNYRVNGQKVGDWQDIPIYEMMQKMGMHGFEFVAFDGDNYIFKRPLVVPKKTGALQSLDSSD